MRRINSRISPGVQGRPGARRELPSYLHAIRRAVPLQEGLWSDNRGKAPESIPPEVFRFGGQSAALVIGESWLFVQLLPQDLYLFLEVFDDELLVAVEPTGQADEQELQSVHRPILPNSFFSFESRLAPH